MENFGANLIRVGYYGGLAFFVIYFLSWYAGPIIAAIFLTSLFIAAFGMKYERKGGN